MKHPKAEFKAFVLRMLVVKVIALLLAKGRPLTLHQRFVVI